MIIPLYKHKEHEKNLLVRTPSKGNTGLWYNKFFGNWNKEDWKLENNSKLNWIKAVVGERNGKNQKTGDTKLLIDYRNRINCLVHALGGNARVFSTNWHLATGLGLSHPIENGMTWHHTLGVPYLPGSSLKGIIRTWAEQWADIQPSEINRIFGPYHNQNDKKANRVEEAVGTVIFFDALPLEPVELAADIMTPHYQEYYSQNNKIPGDWYDPTPIPFLTVGADQLFLFAVAPRKKEFTSDVDLVLQWMEAALTTIGAGAKTSAGYGRFTRRLEQEKSLLKSCAKLEDKKKNKEKESLIPKELAGPIAEEMEKDGYSGNVEKFMELLTKKWLVRMKDKDTAIADRKIIASLLRHWYQERKPDQWQKPNKKNAQKIADIREVLVE